MTLSPLSTQLVAIKAPPGPTLVVAGPGAGKTFCLIGRVNYLIAELGFAPERILAVTFTNRAAEEIALCHAASVRLLSVQSCTSRTQRSSSSRTSYTQSLCTSQPSSMSL